MYESREILVKNILDVGKGAREICVCVYLKRSLRFCKLMVHQFQIKGYLIVLLQRRKLAWLRIRLRYL